MGPSPNLFQKQSKGYVLNLQKLLVESKGKIKAYTLIYNKYILSVYHRKHRAKSPKAVAD